MNTRSLSHSSASDRPFLRRGSASVRRRTDFPPDESGTPDNIRRLAMLAGLQCPRCGERLIFDGRMLRCQDYHACGYGWREAVYAEDEVYCGITV